MALSGSFQSNAITSVTNNNYPRYLIVEWSAIQSIADNTSTVSYTVKASGLKTTSYCQCGPITVTLGGRTLYSTTSRVKIYSASTLASGSFIVNHNNETGEARMAASIQAAIFDGYINSTYSGTQYLDTIPRAAKLLTATDFNDEQNPTITYSNPAGNSVTSLQACISFTGATDDIAYRDISKTGSTYTFQLTDAERKILRQNTTSADGKKSVIFYLKTVIGGTTLHSTLYRTLSLIYYSPQIAASVYDDNEITRNLTGNDSVFVKYYSIARYTIGGIARKEATITSYEATNGTKKATTATGILTGIESDTFTFKVTDSRGLSASATATKTLIPYVPLTCKINPKMLLSTSDSTQAELTVNVEGNYFNGSFGAENNSLLLEVRLTDESNNVTSYTISTSDLTFTGNTFKGKKVISGLDYRTAYVVTVEGGDALTTVSAQSDPIRATPVFDWGANDFAFNVPTVTIQGASVTSLVEQGTTYSGWNYRKWSDGLYECWQRKVVNTTLTNVSSVPGWHTSGAVSATNLSYPITFTEIPTVNVNLSPTTNTWALLVPGSTPGSTSQTGNYQLLATYAHDTNRDYIFNYHVRGRWK